jgi:hypothetical protein
MAHHAQIGFQTSAALSAVGSSFATLAKLDSKSEKQHSLIKTP